jgi:hypothetical protein
MSRCSTFKQKPTLEVRETALGRLVAKWRIIPILGMVFLFSAYNSCSRVPGTTESGSKQREKNPPANLELKENRRPQDPALVCEHIRDIKVLPFHGDRGEDPSYDAFLDAGETAVPCLIKKITNTDRIPDPRPTLKFPETTVGDIAYFLIIDITKLDFAELLPREVQEDYRNNGVWAYHAYVAKLEHRKILQNRLYEWYRQKYGSDARERSASPS